MAQTVNVPGVGQLSFPDGMSQDDMAKAIQANYPQLHGTQAQSPDLASQQGDQGTSAAGVQGKVLSNGKVMQATPADQTDPTADMSTSDKLVAGMGKAYSNVLTGAQQLGQNIGNWAAKKNEDGTTALTSSIKQTQAEVAAQRETDKALMATKAGQAGDLLGQMTMVVAMPGGGLATAAGTGAAMGALTPTAAGESSSQNAVINGLLGAAGFHAGQLLGKIAGGVLQPFRADASKVGETMQEGADILMKNGIPLTAAQQGGGKLARTLQNTVEDSPFIGSSLANEQKQAFTSSVMRQLGVAGAEDASPSVMLQAKQTMGAGFDKYATKYPIPVGNTLLNDLSTITTAAKSELSDADLSIINRQVDNVINHAAATGTMSGEAFQNARSSLSRLQSKQDLVGHWAGEVHDALTSALQREATPQDAQAITQLRTQWKALRNVQGAIGPDNMVNPAALYGMLDRQKNVNAMVFGQGDQSLVQLAQAGKNVLGSNTANSGTTQRVMGMLALGSTMGAIDGLVRGDPKEALEVGILGAGGPMLAKMAVENPKSARIIGQWARSKALVNFRQSVKSKGAELMGMGGSSVSPMTGGFGQSSSDSDDSTSGEVEQ